MSLLFAASVIVHAGPPPQVQFPRPVKTVEEAANVQSGDSVVMVCPACKTLAIMVYKSPWPNGRGTPEWVRVGTEHKCAHCGGEIKVVNGKTSDSMQHDCSVCGSNTAFCCVVQPDKDQTPAK